MFFIENEHLKLTQNRVVVCPVEDIPRAIQELHFLLGTVPSSTIEERNEERFTSEGIDRLFRAEVGFVPSREYWQEDSPRNWEGLTGAELFNRYQKHAETYCEGCAEYGMVPSYAGFREWLIKIRDTMGDGESMF